MSLLPAVVPLVTEKRSEHVPARLARKVAPLFGIPWELNPFGPITWLSDFNKITLSEIARGAPSPSRAELDALRKRGAVPDDGWAFHGRAVVAKASLPNEIVNATLNRYGPDTKSAVLLTATNTLLEPITTAIRTALPLLRGADGAVHPIDAMTGWATVVIEAFRSQPALLIAAFQARGIQRIRLSDLRFPWPERQHDRLARSEICSLATSTAPSPVTHPKDLPLLDHTLDALSLPRRRNRVSDPSNDLNGGRLDAGFVRPKLTRRLIELLLDAADPAGVGYVWPSERSPDQEVAEAILPSDTIVGGLLSWFSDTHAHVTRTFPKLGPLRLPDRDELAALSPLALRVLVLAWVGVVRRHRSTVAADISTAEFEAELTDLEHLIDMLEPNDPVAVTAAWRCATIWFDVVMPTANAADISNAVDALTEHIERGLALWSAGILDRGITADLISASCVQLNGARRYQPELDTKIRALWARFAELLEIDFNALDRRAGLGFVLHNYATFLASHRDSRTDLRAALDLFDNVVIPHREALDERIGAPVAKGRALYLAANAATALAELTKTDGRTDEANALLRTAVDRLTWLLDQPEYLDREPQETIPIVLNTAPGILLAVESGVHPHPAAALRQLNTMVQYAEKAFSQVRKDAPEKVDRYDKLEDIKRRLAAIRHQ